MLSDRQVVVLETRRSCILVWDLETHHQMRIPFNFKNEESDQSAIYVFPDSRWFCVQENGRYNDNTFRLSYYHIDGIGPESVPFHVFDSEDAWTYEYMIRKADDHSMLCWFKGRHDDGFAFRTYDLREEGQHYNKY